MNEDVSEIICLCISINRRASEIYGKLSDAEENEELRQFWAQMANEEKIHASFWDHVEKIAEEYSLPHVFDDPLSIRNDLKKLVQKVEILFKCWESSQNLENALVLAYRLEYYMFHPELEILC